MLKTLCFVSAAGLLSLSACVVNDSDDDGASSVTNPTGDDGNTNTNTNTNTNGMTSNGMTTNDPTTGVDSSSSGVADSSSGSADSSGSGGNTALCGWGRTGQPSVPMGYVCTDNEEPDPSGDAPRDCPVDVTLEVGARCGTIEGDGCCSPEGDAWFCVEQGGNMTLMMDDCM